MYRRTCSLLTLHLSVLLLLLQKLMSVKVILVRMMENVWMDTSATHVPVCQVLKAHTVRPVSADSNCSCLALDVFIY